MDWKRLAELVAVPIIVDGRNCLDPALVEKAGFEYYGMGRQLRTREGRQVLCEF
jgi:UDPglucose 6-dehydrogenase